MFSTDSHLRRAWSQIFTPLDPFLRHASWRGELLHARGRIAVVAVLVLLVAVRFSERVNSGVSLVLIQSVAVLGLLIAIWLERWIAKRGPVPRLGTLSSLLDITLVSSVLMTLAVTGNTSGAVNSRVIFSVYFLIILSTTLRFTPSICLTVGLAVVAQYAVVVVVAHQHPMRDLGPDTAQYGTFVLVEQIYRLVMLAIGSIIALATVIRVRGLLETSARDALTGLLNRRFLDARLEEEVVRATRDGSPLAVALLDVDDFKQFNDRWGHPAGDQVLRAFAEALLTTFRASDIVTRYGGEEFAILMPGATTDTAVVRVTTALSELRRLRLSEVRGAADVCLTASGGVIDFGPGGHGCVAEDGESPRAIADRLIEIADQMLLTAKARGKDQVVVFGGVAGPEEPSETVQGRVVDGHEPAAEP